MTQPPVHGGATWQTLGVHWHAHTQIIKTGDEIDVRNRTDYQPLTSPDDVLDWWTDQLAALNLPNPLEDPHRAEIEAARLSWGKSTGLTIALPNDTVLVLYARAAGPDIDSWSHCTDDHSDVHTVIDLTEPAETSVLT